MFQSIVFYVGEKSVMIYEKEFVLGEIAAQVLNISPDDYHAMKSVLAEAEQALHSYNQTKDVSFWAQANEHYKTLDAMLCRWPILSHIKSDSQIFNDAKELIDDIILTGNCDFLPDDDDDFKRMFPHDDMDESQMRRFMLICPGNLKTKWIMYLNHVKTYTYILSDISSFNSTMQWFIPRFLSPLEKLNTENYARALYSFFNHPGADKMIANPISGTGYFTLSDPVKLQYVPMPVPPDSENYQIVEYYEANYLQTLLKIDFYKALKAGHIIRRCEYCKRYFLLTKAYHTKYCDQPCPDEPRYTCAQIGYRYKKRAEKKEDDPKAQSLHRCLRRIDQDVSRGIITDNDRQKLRSKAKDLFHQARIRSGTTNDEFETMLHSENLYPTCDVIRKTRPKGRPKKED